MKRAIALSGIEPIAEPLRKDVLKRKRSRRVRGFDYPYGLSGAWPMVSSGLAQTGTITGTWDDWPAPAPSAPPATEYQSLMGSSLRQRVAASKLAWDGDATRVHLGRQERQELDAILVHDLAYQHYDSSLLDNLAVNIVGLRVMFVDADSHLSVP